MSSLVTTLAEVNNCLRVICGIEHELLDISFVSIFKKKDHVGMVNGLDVVITRLKQLIETFDEIKEVHYDFSSNYLDILKIATEYSETLMISTLALQKLNIRLQQKNIGQPYSMSEYNVDLKGFHYAQNVYSTIGYRLNSLFNLYATDLLREEAEKEEKKEGEEEEKKEAEEERKRQHQRAIKQQAKELSERQTNKTKDTWISKRALEIFQQVNENYYGDAVGRLEAAKMQAEKEYRKDIRKRKRN